MCTTVEKDSEEYWTIGDMKAAGFDITSDDYVFDEDFVEVDDQSCLCCLDVEAVLHRSQYTWLETDWGYKVF